MNEVSKFSASALKGLVGVDGELKSLNDLKNIKMFDRSNYDSIPSFKENGVGVVYAVEMGSKIKIGYSTNPRKRYITFLRNSRYGEYNIGKIIISDFHLDYRLNETKLHKYFKEKRVPKTELFNVSLQEAAEKINKLKLEFERTINDNSGRIGFDAVCLLLGLSREQTDSWYEDVMASMK